MIIHFLENNPVIGGLIVLVVLITVVPACAAIYRRFRLASGNEQTAMDNKSYESRFLGIQLDIAMLIFGIVLLLGLVGWVWEAFF